MCCTVLIGSVIGLALLAGSSLLVEFSFLFTLVGGSTILPVVSYYILKKLLYLRKIPPGPYSFPVVGSLVDFHFENAILKCMEYKKKYGKIFSLTVGHFPVIVISDYKMIQEALKRDEFQGRPDFEAWIRRNGGYKNRGILLADGDKNWQDQRRFALRTLKDFGFGKQSLDDLLLHEVQDLIRVFKRSIGKPVAIKYELNSAVFNSLWYILSGKRFESGDPKFTQLMGMLSGHIDQLSLFNPAHYFPWVAKLNLIRQGLWAQSEDMQTKLLDLMDEIIHEHLDSYRDGMTRDFIDVYLQTHFQAHDVPGFSGEEGIRNLRVTLLDLFYAGTETTSTTISWAILYITRYPDVQKKLHAEIDQVMASNRLPTRENRQSMPYLEAFTNEVQRMASLLPMGVSHKVLQDSNFGGFLFKKDTLIVPFLWAAHRDSSVWGNDVNEFRPERFLDPTGTKLVHKDALMPFSTGKRVCLGESLARDSLFYFLAGLLQSFSFQLDNSRNDLSSQIRRLDMEIPKPNFIRSPHEYKVIMTSRDTV